LDKSDPEAKIYLIWSKLLEIKDNNIDQMHYYKGFYIYSIFYQNSKNS
jgi:hypothetical protein